MVLPTIYVSLPSNWSAWPLLRSAAIMPTSISSVLSGAAMT